MSTATHVHGNPIVGELLHHLVVEDGGVGLSSTHTRNPSSPSPPALPLLIHSVWISKIEKTFSSWGIV